MADRLRSNTWKTKIIPGEANENFKRIRPSTWNMGYIGKSDTNSVKSGEKVGEYGPEKEDVFYDAKTGLYYVENSCCPHDRKYVSKTRITFS
jgi:hypothetical protein